GLHVTGVEPRWAEYFAPVGAHRVDLPTYAFQHQHYWLAAQPLDNVSSAGLTATEHPLLRALVELPEEDGFVLTGRLSAAEQRWSAHHDLEGVTEFPGTGLLELALCTADRIGCGLVRRLTVEESLVLSGGTPTALRVVVGAPDEAGERQLTVHSRPEGADVPWTLHAKGVLAEGAGGAPEAGAGGMEAGAAWEDGPWPPLGAAEVDVDELYEQLLGRGYGYGPAFQGLTAAWRRGDELFAEVVLPEEAGQADRFGVHPALLDAALQAERLHTVHEGAVVAPAEWQDVVLHAAGAKALRARITPGDAGRVSVTLTDPSGLPVLSVAALASRKAQEGRPAGVRGDALFRLDWIPADHPLSGGQDAGSGLVLLGDGPAASAGSVPAYADPAALAAAIGEGAQEPALAVLLLPPTGDDVPEAARNLAELTLDAVRKWLAEEELNGSRLAVVTRGAVSVHGADADAAQATVWGLVRAAQAEHPGRFLLVDLDGDPDREQGRELDTVAGHEDPWRAVAPAVAAGEPEAAVRGGAALVPRLRTVSGKAAGAPPWSPDGTVLITGGTQGVGAAIARHLVSARGVKRLVLTGTSADPLVAELNALGAEVTVEQCAAADPGAPARLLSRIGDAHPLTAVVHAESADHNATIGSLTPDRLMSVLNARATAAWNLHEATRDHQLDAFVMLATSSGLLHGAGQAATAAANTFLEALAHHRHALGLPAVVSAFGPWAADREQRTGDAAAAPAGEGASAAGAFADGYERRMSQAGLPTLGTDEGLGLLDAVAQSGEPALFPLGLDRGTLRTLARELPDALPHVLRGLVPVHGRRTAAPGTASANDLRRRLSGLTPQEREQELLDLVRTHVASVLGHASMDAIEPGRAFQELGFDSLAGVELRRRLAEATGLQLTATLVFDYPNSRAAADHIAAQLAPAEEDAARSLLTEIDRLEAVLGSYTADDAHIRITSRLEALLRKWRDSHGEPDTAEPGSTVEAATDDELFGVLDQELGIA
ncbi:KR domain-containing protein, partial [Streptomyces sp. NPDC008163]|uniref:type I polyketide synthase n=1 Tax=Streptomyces sp. NPDC008163 TaxID=3364818 RepID=UPI0036E976A5